MSHVAEPVAELYTEEDRLEIQRAYRRLLKSIKTPLSDQDKHDIRRAYEIAVEAHSPQRRKSGEAYILHPIEVARICAEEIGLGATAIVAALLHDTVEDTTITLPDIKSAFGEKVEEIVNGLTKLEKTYDSESPQAENIKKILGTLIVDVRIVLIKMADRLHNMRTLGSMPQHKQLKIAAETEFIYAPLAHRLGLYNVRSEFLDLCLKITHREEYGDIAQKLNETKKERASYIHDFINPIEEHLDEEGIKYRISGRPKSIYSIWNKMKQKNCKFEDIYDLFAVRIIVDVPIERERSDCWAAYSIVTSVHTPMPERLKDWVTIPKSNGYESLHTTVIGPEGRFVEVQIRSERMDEIAERGYAAHWKYKNIRKQEDVFERWFDQVRKSLEEAGDGNSVDFVNDFKTTNLFAEEVYVYTPKGDMKILPKGATALDFAFYIHSDIGVHCQAVKINNRLVPLGYKLQHGDQISVETNKKRSPSEDWLKWVVTGKAREKIRQSLREDAKKVAEFGREALVRKFDHIKVDFDSGVEVVMKHFGFKTKHEFFLAISNEAIELHEDLKVFKIEKGRLQPVEEEEKQIAQSEPRKSNKPALKTELFINGDPAKEYLYELADCCRPVQGDDVFAYITINNIYKIHRTVCNNASNLMSHYGHRIAKAEWGASAGMNFIAELLIIGVDSGPGVIERLSNRISSDLGLNIRSFSIEGNEGFFEGRVKVVVSHRDQLVLAIKALKGIDGVNNVVRVD
jgi:GTP diphosphokinase / guanosine-3',5'-bis(diphosphate) 3'-diphosphatase